MKNIAVITGASSGIGKQFALTLQKRGSFDEVWVIARRAERLEALKSQIPFPVKVLPLDLSDKSSFKTYETLLSIENPNITLLINCSGFGKFCAMMDCNYEENLNMVNLNCGAVLAMCQLSIPYMEAGAKIINIASVAGYQPIPYINVYGATKSFVLNFSRALNRELKKQKISVMAVCPFWTKTEFFKRAIDEDEERVVKKYVAMYTPEKIVAQAWRDLKWGKDVSMYGFKAKMQTMMVKLAPHSMVMSVWMKQQDLK
ncbi:MAG: SDR family NAD(P)-dependent oxidoreductase [Clostridia bacterium]|nr:SDR family NAD(P)-dependent oxidoreductase [Clostridia bacterium]